MWVKLIGGVLVVTATSWIGFAAAQCFQQRPRQLRALQAGLQMLETEISYGVTPLPKAMGKVAQSIEGPTGDFFAAVSNQFLNSSGITMREAWSKGLEFLREHCVLTECDQNILDNFGTTLGVSDRHDQVKHLQLVMAQLTAAETNAWEEKARNERMFKSLGLLGGLAIVILLY